jgi:hypothetical protein
MMYTATRPSRGPAEQLARGRLSGRQERARERGPECVDGAQRGEQRSLCRGRRHVRRRREQHGGSMTAGAATSKASGCGDAGGVAVL